MRDIDTVIVKQMFKNQDDTLGKVIEYTGLELAWRILPNDVINAKYSSNSGLGGRSKIIPYFQRVEETLPGEEWKQHLATSLWVSNFGRIKTPDGTIEPQRDKTGKTGYLQLVNWQEIERKIGFKFGNLEYVYQLVAETWLEKDIEQEKWDKDGSWQVHHITNDGYDNRPENLIWLKEDLHLNNGIHGLYNKRKK